MLKRLPVDAYTLALLGTVALARFVPARGTAAAVLDVATSAGVALLFFLYGARLERSAITAGVTHWRLQLGVLLATFALFPLVVFALRFVCSPFVPSEQFAGLLFLSVLPSTVQSSIAFTSIARGNVPAAICAAAVSNLAGVLLTPLLTGLLFGGAAGFSLDGVRKIALLLLAPFALGHALRPLLGPWVARNRAWLSYVDRGSILLVVYAAFSSAVVSGLWAAFPPRQLALLFALSSLLLAAVMGVLTLAARRLGLSKEDEIALVFCGSKKSLAAGMPMAKVLFAGPSAGLMVLPLMLFHQLQLLVCAQLAQRYVRREAPVET